MVYSPEEYERLKAFYKEDLAKRKAIQEQFRRALLRQKAEWHVAQMRASLERLGIAPEAEGEPSPTETPNPTADSPPDLPPDSPPKTLL